MFKNCCVNFDAIRNITRTVDTLEASVGIESLYKQRCHFVRKLLFSSCTSSTLESWFSRTYVTCLNEDLLLSCHFLSLCCQSSLRRLCCASVSLRPYSILR